MSKQEYADRCIFCGKVAYQNECPECRHKKLYYSQLIFCTEYRGDIRKKIHEYKFSDKKYYFNFFSELLFERLRGIEVDLIIPVPISKERYRERGYNQSGIIAKKLGKMLNIEFADDILVKIKDSKRQSMQNLNERKESVKNIFKVDDILRVRGKSVILIDDVFATGSTVNECSKALKFAGSKNIKVAVISISHALK